MGLIVLFFGLPSHTGCRVCINNIFRSYYCYGYGVDYHAFHLHQLQNFVYMPDSFKHYSTVQDLTSKPAMRATRCLSTKYMDP